MPTQDKDTIDSLTRSVGRLHTRLRQMALRNKQTADQKEHRLNTVAAKAPAAMKPDAARKAAYPKPKQPPVVKRQVPPHLKQYQFKKK